MGRRAFQLQYESNEPYRRYCRRLGIAPEEVAGWPDVPPVPTAAFRQVLFCVETPAPPLVFRTSGTTRGRPRRGRHAVPDPNLYRASLEAAFLRHVLDGQARWPICSLIPPFSVSGDSSLSWMVDAVLKRFGGPESIHAAGSGGFDGSAVNAFVENACDTGAPVCLLATTLGAAEWVARLRAEGRSYRLPPGSRLMDTGGAKGRAGLERAQVVEQLVERLGLEPTLVINEFGMTELLSQRYSRPASSGPPRRDEAPASVRLHAPPWLRTRALDPNTLEPVPAGELGVLCHFDLANAGSVCAILTEDLGRVRGDELEWVGRTPGSPPRGCSLATARLLEAQGD
ncbi:MAG: hypothetical protein ACE5HQ_07850 [Gemmatimonadota bacterium]